MSEKMKKRLDSMVFDIGGVLVADVWEHLLLDPEDSVAAVCGLDFQEVARFAPELWKEFELRPCTAQDTPEKLEKLYWERFRSRFPVSLSVDELIGMTDAFIRPVPGMAGLLEKLVSRGIPVAICSNNNEFWIRKQMDKAGLHRFFPEDRVISSSRVGAVKDSPEYEMFKAVTQALGPDCTNTWFVDDRFENIVRCKAYGWTGIFFPQAHPGGADYLESILTCAGW